MADETEVTGGTGGDDLDILKEGSDPDNVKISETGELPGDVADDDDDEKEPDEQETETEGAEEETEETEEEDTEGEDKEPEDEEVQAASETFRSIKKYDPKFFKKFPWVAAALNREKEYANHFGSVDDAKEAVTRLSNVSLFENSLMEGDPTLLLSTMKDASPEAFKKLSSTFLETALKVDPSIAREAISPILKNVLKRAVADAGRTNNDNLRKAAQWIAKYTGLDLETADSAPAGKTDDREKQLREREAAVNNRLYTAYDTEVNFAARNGLTRDVERALDPEKKMSKFTREALVEKIVNTIDLQLGKDKSHLSGMENLWRQAMRSGLDPSFKQRIVSAYLGRARTLIPTIKRQVVGRSSGNGEDKEKRVIPSSGGSGKGKISGSKLTVADARKSKLSDEDILKAP